ncbi:MAG: DUF2911 domain-containing protein [Acidobacteriota bacterium]
MKQHTRLPWLALAVISTLALASVADAQVGPRQAQHIFAPLASPGAEVAQGVGVTKIHVSYHRPAVNDRDLWGAVVPSGGPIWRTGANENTLVSFSTDVSVQGQPLAAGTYGLHTIPGKPAGEAEWTIIFSKDTQAWGSFAYKEENDALRVTAKPQAAPHQERFEIAFDNLTADSTHMVLHWGEVAVPVKVSVDLAKTVKASFEEQLTGLSAFFWQGWSQAAQYSLQNDLNLEDAMGWVDQSIGIQENFNNLSVKAQLLVKKGEAGQASELMVKAMDMGNAGQIHNYARQLLGQGKTEQALVAFKKNVAKHPETWFVELGLARAYSAVGDFDNAVKNMKIAHGKAPEQQKQYVQGLVEQLQNKVDIN